MITPTVDPTFYRTAAEAAAAPPEEVAYVMALDPEGTRGGDALAVVDVNRASTAYGQVVGWADAPGGLHEFHHFGWNACSSAFKHEGHDMHGLARRYLVVPGIRSSNIFVFDTLPEPRNPVLVKTIDAKELLAKTGYSRPHTVHCGPDALYLTCLAGSEPDGGPGGIAMLDHTTFEPLRAWETDRGPQRWAYDAWWHLNANVLISSEWGPIALIEPGLNPEALLAHQYGHRLHFWDLATGKHQQEIDLGAEHQMVLEVRPAHNPDATWGYVGVVISTEDLSGSIWRWFHDGKRWQVEKVITIPAEPADPDLLPPLLKPFTAVPPLITDIDLSVDDRFLYLACYGTGDLKQFDVTDPAHPRETGSVRLGGIASRAPHPAKPDTPYPGAPQMLEVSRDGRRVYFTNSLYGSWDLQFYPDGLEAGMVKLDVDPGGGLRIDENFYPHGEQFRGRRIHQIRLQGGDASTDSYCYR